MSEYKHSNTQRRKLLKSALIGGGILGASGARPDNWLKPVINTVVLPAHAVTTDDTGLLGANLTTTTLAPASKYYSEDRDAVRACELRASALDLSINVLQETLIPSAYAKPNNWVEKRYLEDLGNGLYHFIYQATGSDNSSLAIDYENFSEGDISVGQTRNFLRQNCNGNGDADSTEVTLVSVTAGMAVVEIWGCNYELPLTMSAVAPVYIICET